MLFWIFMAMMPIGVLISLRDDDCSSFTEIGIVIVVVGAVVSIFMAPFILALNTGLDGKVAELEARYESLVYQYENDIYDNDNDLGKRELMKDIEEWNAKIAKNQANQDNFWIGIFIPDIYYQFDPIELK